MDTGKPCGTPDAADGQRNHFGMLPDCDFVAAASDFAKAWPDKIKVMVSEPTMGIIDYQAHESCCDLICSLKDYERTSNYKFFKTSCGRLMVQYAREVFAEYAVNMGFDYIFYIDDDHVWDPDTFQKLEKWLKDYDIVAPLCVQRQPPYNPVIYRNEFKNENGQTVFYNRHYVETKEIKKGDIITDADSIGFGAAIVKVDLFKRVERPWFMTMSPVGEDIYFCAKATHMSGAKILVDTNVEAPHLKNREPASFGDFLREKNANKHSDAIVEK